jgi:hypothetical protein
MVEELGLLDVGRRAHGPDPSAIECEECEDGFGDLCPVLKPTTG